MIESELGHRDEVVARSRVSTDIYLWRTQNKKPVLVAFSLL